MEILKKNLKSIAKIQNYIIKLENKIYRINSKNYLSSLLWTLSFTIKIQNIFCDIK